MPDLKPRQFPRWRMGMQAELILLVLLVLLPLLSLEIVGICIRFRQNIQQEIRASQELAETIDTAFQHYLASLWDSELAIGTAITSSLPPEDTDRLMAGQLKAHSTVESFNWVSPSGIILRSTDPRAIGLSCADREHIQRIFKGEDEVISGVIPNRVTNTANLFAARAIRLQNRLVGIMVATLNPANLGQALPGQRTGHSNFGLVDNHGMMVFRSNTPGLPLSNRRLKAASPSLKVLRTGRPLHAALYTSTIDGSQRIGVFLPIPKLGWVSYATARADEVLSAATTEAFHSSIILIVLIFTSLAAAHFIARRFLRPIRALEEAAVAISQGDFTPRVGFTSSKELTVATQAFNQMADRIQQLESDRKRFVQVAAHELRNPMATIKGSCSLIRLQMSHGSQDFETLRDVQLLEHGVNTLATLLDEILDTIRLQGDNFPLKLEPANLSEVIHNSLESFLFLDPHHRFVFEDWPAATVLGDSRRLENVFRNLIGNAAKYSPKGTTVRIRLEVQDHWAVISVRDRGRGISPEDMKNLFKPFFRGNQAALDTDGMGLGLYICENIISRHEGRIRAESQKGRGTTFFVELPLYDEPPAV